MAGVTEVTKDHVSHEMGMHTEGLRGRSQQRFFDITEENVGFGYPDALDVDFNKRAEIDAENLDSRQINQQLRDLMKQGYGTIVLQNPGSKHSVAVGILNRLKLSHRGLLRLFRLRSRRRPQRQHQGSRRLGVRGEHAFRNHRDREERRFAVRRRHPRRRPRLQRVGRGAHRHRPEGRYDPRRRRYRLVHGLHDAARPHGHLRQRRQEPRRQHVRRHDLHRRRAAQPGRRRGAGRT